MIVMKYAILLIVKGFFIQHIKLRKNKQPNLYFRTVLKIEVLQMRIH